MKYRLTTFTFLLFTIDQILGATNDECISTQPFQKDDCVIKSTPNNNCCYKVYNFGTSKSCVLIEKSLANFNPIVTENGKKAFIDCGPIGAVNSTTDINENSLKLPYRVCGVTNPKEAGDCNSHSVFGNSCCLYQSNGKTGCYWLGKTYFGEASFDNLKVTCSSEILNTFGLLLISLLISILF